MKFLTPFSLAVLSLATASAHPVSFEGAWQIMLGTSGPEQDVEVYHSYSAKTAWGFQALRYQDDEDDYYAGIQHNWLLHRWNLPDSQANIYLGLGGGFTKQESSSASPGGLAYFRADYETRRVYTAIESKFVGSDDVSRSVTRASVGFAPYKAEFDELNTWIILEAEHMSGMAHDLSLIPKVRLFKGNAFVELGCSLRGEPLLNLMFHF